MTGEFRIARIGRYPKKKIRGRLTADGGASIMAKVWVKEVLRLFM